MGGLLARDGIIDFNHAAPQWDRHGRLRSSAKPHQAGVSALRDVEVETLFTSMARARAVVAAWLVNYHIARPHSALGYQTPAAHAAGRKAMGQSFRSFRAPSLAHCLYRTKQRNFNAGSTLSRMKVPR
jgi:hypothetical protein